MTLEKSNSATDSAFLLAAKKACQKVDSVWVCVFTTAFCIVMRFVEIFQEGNEIFTLTGLKSKTTYRLRWQAPDKQYPDIVVETHGKFAQPIFYITDYVF